MAQGSGTITSLSGTVIANIIGDSSVVFNVTGTWTATIGIQATVDNINWFNVSGYNPSNQTSVSSFSINQPVVVSCSGFVAVQLIATFFTSGTINIAWSSSFAGANAVSVTETFSISGAPTVQQVDNDGILFNTGPALHVTDYLSRQIQEQILLLSDANLLSAQLTHENTSKYNFKEIR